MRAALGGAIATLALVAPATAGARGTPVPTTGVATAISFNSASLTATVNPNGEATEVYFQYGTTDTYGAQSAPTELPAGTRTVAVSIVVTGLVSLTTYHYRIVAINATGTALGVDQEVQDGEDPARARDHRRAEPARLQRRRDRRRARSPAPATRTCR